LAELREEELDCLYMKMRKTDYRTVSASNMVSGRKPDVSG